MDQPESGIIRTPVVQWSIYFKLFAVELKRMSKVLVVGYNPPVIVPTVKVEAAHYRTWQFLEPLLADGHAVHLCAGTRDELADSSAVPSQWRDRLTYSPIPFGREGWAKQLQVAHDAFAPDCVIAVNFSHCLYVTKLQTPAPIWMEIYGDMLTIMQAAYYRQQSDRGLGTQISFMHEVLRKGDVFSGCGQPQCHMLVGELAMAGRLNRSTFGYEFTRVILPGAPPKAVERTGRVAKRALLAEKGIANDDFVVLWCGGYNTWTDVETLFRGLEDAMAANPKLHYVSVGASTYDAPDNVYERFQALAAGSRFAGRYHMMGWRPWSEMETYYRESDVGINIDALHYETLYGTRTRLVEMIALGLPIVTSLGPELSYLLRDAGAALTFAVGDWATLGRNLQRIAGDSALAQEMAVQALAYAQKDLSFASTTAPLREWVANPAPAPDKGSRTRREMLQNVEYRTRTRMRLTMWRVAGIDR
jgi:glycosyltransferase involved in cell wall biosynthesis